MVNAKHIGGVGAAAVTFGKSRRGATRMTASIRDTALVVMALFWQCWIRRPRWKSRMSTPKIRRSTV